MALAFLPADEASEHDRRVDWFGITLLVVAVGSLQTMLEQGRDDDWFSSKFITALAVAAFVGGSLFVWRQLSVAYPVVDLRVLKHRSLAAGSAFSAVLGMGLYGALFAVPIFAQQILGYTAQETGLLLMPGAIASAFMMPLIGKLTKVLDARIIIAAGAVLLVTALLMLADLNPSTGEKELFVPLMVRGAGTAMMFLPLSLATIGPLPKKDIAAGSGIYNLTRQLGGSIGIALMTTIVSSREAFHRAVLVEKLGVSDPMVQGRVTMMTNSFASKGLDINSAKAQALHILDLTVTKQAAILSFADTFWLVSVFIILSIPLVFLLGKGRGVKAPAEAH
jgi:DHA2 family multidrug resistance protein